MAKKLGEVAVESVVKLNESGKPIEFYVAQQGSPGSAYYGFNGVTVLMRKYIHSKQSFGSDNDYANGPVHSWLNNEISGYLSLFDKNIVPFFKNVKIPYFYGSGGGYNHTVKSGAEGLSCTAFLASINEVGENYSPVVGTTLAYFYGKTASQKVAQYEGVDTSWATRVPNPPDDWRFYTINTDGEPDNSSGSIGVRPFVCLSSDLFVKSDGTITPNEPPTAPGSIDVSGVVSGGSATITLTAATDPDGTVESYRYERSVDGGEFQQFADANSLTQTDTISEEWGTVAYRACAVDDAGAAGPYVTSETETVNSGWVLIGGPVSNLGVQSIPFDFKITVGVSGQSGVTGIAVYIKQDGDEKYNDTVNQDDKITIPIDTRVLGSGKHEIQVVASKDELLSAAAAYYFTVPSFTLPEGGRSEVIEGPDGQPIFPYTTARNVIGPNGVNIQTEVDRIKKSHRGITGHLAFLDAVLGPATKKYERDSSAAYAVHGYAPIGTSNPGGLICVYPGYTGQIDSFLTVSEAELNFTVPSNVVMALYEFVMDALPDVDVDPTVNFEALAQPRVLSAATNTGTAATDLSNALNQILKAFPAQNYYAMRSTDGNTTYYIATASRVTADTTSITGAYVSSANPQKWYQGVQITLLNTSDMPGLFEYLNPPIVASATSANAVTAGTTLNDTLLAMIKAQPTYYRYRMQNGSGTVFYLLSPAQITEDSLTASNVLYCTAGGTYYSGETMELGVTKLFTEMNWPPVIEFGTENQNTDTGRGLAATLQEMLASSDYLYLYALWDSQYDNKRIYIASPTQITQDTINNVSGVSYVREQNPDTYFKNTSLTLPWIKMMYIGKYSKGSLSVIYPVTRNTLQESLKYLKDSWTNNTHLRFPWYYTLDPATGYPRSVFDLIKYTNDYQTKVTFKEENIGEDPLYMYGVDENRWISTFTTIYDTTKHNYVSDSGTAGKTGVLSEYSGM